MLNCRFQIFINEHYWAMLYYCTKTLIGRLREVRIKGKDQLVIPKSGRGRLRELMITEFKWHSKRGFTIVVVPRAGRLQEWSQGELRLDYHYFTMIRSMTNSRTLRHLQLFPK